MGVTIDYLLRGYPYEWASTNKKQKWIYFGNTQDEMEKSIMQFGSKDEQAEYKKTLSRNYKEEKQILNLFDLLGSD